MAGTSIGAIKGWITRKRRAGVKIPTFKDDKAMVAWAIKHGYKSVPQRNVVGGSKQMHDDPVPGLMAGSERLTEPTADFLKRMRTLQKKNPHGRLIWDALTQRGKNSFENRLRNRNLGHLTQNDRRRLVEWLMKNATKTDIAGLGKRRSKVKAPAEQLGDLPKEGRPVGKPERNPGWIKDAALRRALKDLGIKGTIKTVPMLEQDIVVVGEKKEYADPTADQALRNVMPRKRQGGTGAEVRRKERRRHLQEAWKKAHGKGNIGKSATSRAIALKRAAKYRESMHRRDSEGRFADKPDVPKSPKKRKAPPQKPPKKRASTVPPKPVHRLVKPKTAPSRPKNKPMRGRRLSPTEYDSQAGPIADLDALMKDRRGKEDVFEEVLAAIRNGHLRSLKPDIHNTMSLVAIVEDGNGHKRLLKKTAFDPELDDDQVQSRVRADVIDEFLVSSVMEQVGVKAHHPVGFTSDPNDERNMSIMIEHVDETFGVKTESAIQDEDEFRAAKWADRKEFVGLMLMDYLTNNHDRHSNNWLEYEDEDGRHIVAIDNSLTGAAAARARGHLEIETQKMYPAPDPGKPKTKEDAEATRSFDGWLSQGWPHPGEAALEADNYNAEMAQRVAVLYEGDEEALAADIEEWALGFADKFNTDDIEVMMDKQGLKGTSRKEGEDLEYIIGGRFDELIANVFADVEDDDGELMPSSILQSITDTGKAWSDRRARNKLWADQRVWMEGTWVLP